MNLSKKQLRAIGIYNDPGFVEDGDCWADYSAWKRIGTTSQGWLLHRKGKPFPGAWYSDGCLPFGGRYRVIPDELVEWFYRNYSERELVRSPFGGFIPKTVYTRCMALAVAKYKEISK